MVAPFYFFEGFFFVLFLFCLLFKNCRDVAKNEKENHFEENYRDTAMRARALMEEEGELGFHPFRRLEGLHKHRERTILDSFPLWIVLPYNGSDINFCHLKESKNSP